MSPDVLAATAAATPSLPGLIASGVAYLVLVLLGIVCILAISVVHNRLEEARFVEHKLQANAQKIAGLGGAAAQKIAGLGGAAGDPEFARNYPKLAEEFARLMEEARTLNASIYDIAYKQLYGSQQARDNPKRWADRFHANSDTTNVMIIGLCACAIAVCGAKLLAVVTATQPKPAFLVLFASVTIIDIFLGMLTGLLATFVMKSGSSVLSKTPLASIDVSNPFGVAFVAAVAGLFMDKFYAWLQPLLVTTK